MNHQDLHVHLRTSPHLRESPAVDVIMQNVVYALLPVCAYAVYQFGISVLSLLLVCTGAGVLTEHLICILSAKESTVKDWSAVITGILLALTLPPGFPLWMGAVAAVVGIGIAKMFFGGLGYNIM
ncbi:MAG: RnfABCDGE type electron transport complex subunit D, partial [Candidatus Latescibacteria bacterium]|nr:RnfABCDGE type electron transport complex subunit D [Candidatus Latescibacterota bacterium]